MGRISSKPWKLLRESYPEYFEIAYMQLYYFTHFVGIDGSLHHENLCFTTFACFLVYICFLVYMRALHLSFAHDLFLPGIHITQFLLLFFFFFLVFRAAPMAYGNSQAMGQMGAVAVGHSHSHSNRK